VGKVYPVALILAEKILPGTLRCLHSCRHMLIPIASLPEKNRPKPSAVHSDIQHVYGVDKHLPGKHDQMTHGSWARRTPEGGKREPGHKKGDKVTVGGGDYTVESLDYTSRSGAKAWAKKQDNAAELSITRAPDGKYYVVSKPKADGDAMTVDAPPGVDMAANSTKMAAYQDVVLYPHHVAAASALKAQVSEDLAEATGESISRTSEAIKSWAESSNDNSMTSLAMQQAAELEFGSKMSDWQKEQLKNAQDDRATLPVGHLEMSTLTAYPFQDKGVGGDWPGDTKASTQKFLRAQHDATQAALKAAGVTHVRLYRSIGYPRDENGNRIPYTDGDTIQHEGNAMESWSTSADVALRFPGHTVRVVVPIARIMSTPRTGLGCMNEYEVVVLGGMPGADVVEVVRVG